MKSINIWTKAYTTTCNATATSAVAVIKTRDIKHGMDMDLYGEALVKRFE